MDAHQQLARFEGLILPHLAAAYSLARWLVRSPEDAEDLLQEACLRAFRAFAGFQGGDVRAWLLVIVRNACYSFLERRGRPEERVEFDEQAHSPEGAEGGAANPETLALRNADRGALQNALWELPADFREAIVLRELEGLSYREIADVLKIPIGTVMSRLSRARQQLRLFLVPPDEGEGGLRWSATRR
jgi:RNA polymerase sigma-70 factor (ECF subfamily)